MSRRSQDLARMVQLGRQDVSMYGIQTRMRATASEVITMQASEMYSMLAESLRDIVKVMCERGLNYFVERIDESSTKSAQIEHLKALWTRFTTDLLENLELSFSKLETVVFDEVYAFDPQLFSQGFIRLKHQQNLDVSSLEPARMARIQVADSEQTVEAQLSLVNQRREELLGLEKSLSELNSMEAWLDDVLTKCEENALLLTTKN